MDEAIKLGWLSDGPVTKREERDADTDSVRQLPGLCLFHRNERLEGIGESEALIEEVRQEPAIPAQYPHEQEQECPGCDEEEDEEQECDGKVPDEDSEEVRPNREADAEQKSHHQRRCHQVTHCFVTLVDPGEVSGLIEFAESHHSELSLPTLLASQNELVIAQFLAGIDSIRSVGKSRKVRWPLGSNLGRRQEIDELFALHVMHSLLHQQGLTNCRPFLASQEVA
mmetsp:Transcript_21931/g.62465  ORF Transcript_21931/g.62465 Transcript_21931/m.62465 type:complete len:226 (+) Transcript_21931:303-980(+)